MFFAAKENSVFSAIKEDGKGFAEMLKAGQNEVKHEVKKSQVDLKKVDIKADESFKEASFTKEKTDVVSKKEEVKDHKAVDNKEETSTATEENKKTNTTENKNDEKVEAKTEDQNVEAKDSAVDDATGEENVVTEDVEANVEDDVEGLNFVGFVTPENMIETQKVVDVAEAGVSEVKVEAEVVDVVENDSQTVQDAAETVEVVANDVKDKVVKAEAKVEQNSAEVLQPLTEEEALILEQAKVLDEKAGGDKKLKVEVSVKEEKIADTLTKDVLQNRFEVDAVVKNISSNVEAENEFGEVSAEAVLQESDENATQGNVQAAKNMQAQGVAFAEGKVATEAQKVQVSDANVLSVSGKEVVFDAANAPKTEIFTKINEASNRDAFKGMGKEVVEQIKVNITKSAVKGVDTIDIQLKPEDLGKIQIKMQISKDGKLQAEIISSRPETADLLQKEASNLAKAFNDAGFETDERSFNFSFQKENQARDEQNDSSGLAQFIGDTLEQEAENMAGNDNLVYDPLLGLNIRV